ncbi:cleavage and polyadenylation specificity factor subunit 4-like [Tubulanus polymorphus]|uniref:cleavage and polyadenylation specificity factor subunit 4-like n=1 Tax=Tubulanus polymorphus TaxID=672921 RepID=UPI003DA2B8CC
MQEIVSNVENIIFDIDVALEEQRGAIPLPFPGMDKSGAAICTFYQKAVCHKGNACPFRHVKGDREIVCKHWLRGLCKKGDDCEFLHEYDMSKMPECYFYSKFGACSNKECPFLHIDPESKIKDCPWYDRGFCRHGPNCKNRHVRRVICPNYLCGFCPEGPNCKFMHPKFDIPSTDPNDKTRKTLLICHYCGEFGHKANSCFKAKDAGVLTLPNTGPAGQPKNFTNPATIPLTDRTNQTGGSALSINTGNPGVGGNTAPVPHTPRPFYQQGFRPRFQQHYGHRFQGQHNNGTPKRALETVTCYKCGEKGHYANKCPKGHLAFLSNPGNLPGNAAAQQQGFRHPAPQPTVSYGWGH